MRYPKIFSLDTANSSASSRPILVFLSSPQVPGKWQKPKINYMAIDGYTDKIRIWRASTIFDFVNEFFPQKIQHKVLSLEFQLILSICWLWHLKKSAKSNRKKTMVKKYENHTSLNNVSLKWTTAETTTTSPQ